MLWINGKMTDLTKKDAIHKLVDAKCFLERYSNPHDKWTEAINIGIEAIEIVMDQEEQEPVIDEIRAEMKPYTDPKGFIVIGENRFNMILDKYKAESEG